MHRERHVADSLLEQVTEDEEHVGWPFSEPAHEVSLPLAAVGNIKPHPVAPAQQTALQLTLDAVQHLILEAGADLMGTRQSLCSSDHAAIVSCDSMIDAAQQQLLHYRHKVAV